MNKYLSRFQQFILLLFITTSFLACTGGRKAIKEPIREQGSEFLIGKLKEHELQFQQFAAKFSATYEVDQRKTTVSGNLRIVHDSIIWISISPALGIEAVRFMLTPDSIKYLNRINNTFLVQSFSYINQLLNKTMDFDMAQSFLLGNDFSLYESNSFKASVDNQEYKLNTSNRRKIRRFVRKSEEDISIPLQSIWLDPVSFKISKVLLKEAEKDSRKFQASYKQFENMDGKLIPSSLDFNLETVDKKVRIQISYTKIQLDQETSYPFRIPESYSEIKELKQD